MRVRARGDECIEPATRLLLAATGCGRNVHNLLGEYVLLRETLDGVDSIPEEKLRFIGRMVRAIHR